MPFELYAEVQTERLYKTLQGNNATSEEDSLLLLSGMQI
jgi:hypothetical protein